jgi:hypothetical protein
MSKSARYFVYTRVTGGTYLTEAVSRPGYRWVKDRYVAKAFNCRATAERTARRYGGVAIEIGV